MSGNLIQQNCRVGNYESRAGTTWKNGKTRMKLRHIAYLFVPVVCLALASCGGGESGSALGATATTTPVEATSQLAPDCTSASASCGAVNATTYSGTGIGIWRYNNASSTAATLDINIAGVSAGKVATLVFSNGSAVSATLPSAGAAAVSTRSSAVLADSGISEKTVADQPLQQAQEHAEAHAQMLEKNRVISTGLIRARTAIRPVAELGANAAAASRLSLSPAVGATRSWVDNFPANPVAYPASAQFVCALPSGRNAVWWVDPTIVSSGKFTPAAWSAALGAMQASYCGSAGGLARLNALMGDVWGPAASRQPTVIQDAPGSLQDVNVVLLNVPAGTQWAGYFFGGNNLLKTSLASSNEALAFFINADQVKADLSFATSTLMHESTHMVNFYQRSVARDVIHDTWLEETSAMMTEDIVTPAVVNGYNKVLSYRLPIYLATGGNVSYINWATQSDASPHYAAGGGFGAFLNRRYGLSIFQQLVTSCNDGNPATPALTSYVCLDGLIKANGGVGFGDEFSRFGATLFGQFPSVGTPAGYGYPGTTAGSYLLQGADLSRLRAVPATPLATAFAATSHTYQRDSIAAGQSSYVRNGVVVPANTSLIVIIK